MTTTLSLTDIIARRLNDARTQAARLRTAIAAAATRDLAAGSTYAADIYRLVSDLAGYEGSAAVCSRASAVLAYHVEHGTAPDDTIKALRRWACATATASPGDTWSGRTNDLTRTENDGKRETLRWVVDHLDYEDIVL